MSTVTCLSGHYNRGVGKKYEALIEAASMETGLTIKQLITDMFILDCYTLVSLENLGRPFFSFRQQKGNDCSIVLKTSFQADSIHQSHNSILAESLCPTSIVYRDQRYPWPLQLISSTLCTHTTLHAQPAQCSTKVFQSNLTFHHESLHPVH